MSLRTLVGGDGGVDGGGGGQGKSTALSLIGADGKVYAVRFDRKNQAEALLEKITECRAVLFKGWRPTRLCFSMCSAHAKAGVSACSALSTSLDCRPRRWRRVSRCPPPRPRHRDAAMPCQPPLTPCRQPLTLYPVRGPPLQVLTTLLIANRGEGLDLQVQFWRGAPGGCVFYYLPSKVHACQALL